MVAPRLFICFPGHSGEDLTRLDLCGEALRLGRLVADSPATNPVVHALAALMAFQAARLPARIDEAGDLVLLEDQDRRRWDQRLIALGFHHFSRCARGENVPEYHIQAAIAATHARAESPSSTDWPTIIALYDQLMELECLARDCTQPCRGTGQSSGPQCRVGGS